MNRFFTGLCSQGGGTAMQDFQFLRTEISGLTLITPQISYDRRGYFSKPFEASLFASNGIHFSVVEELESRSGRQTLRGLHFQYRHSQDKLVRALSGQVYDVAVDIRPHSPTFGKWQGFYLSAENKRMLYIPKGFAHGFFVCSEDAVLHYLCGDRYDPDSESGIIWNDPELAVNWPLEGGAPPILSQRDQSFQSFADLRRLIGPKMK